MIRQGLRSSCLWELYLAESKSTDPLRSRPLLVCIYARASCVYPFTRFSTCFCARPCPDYRAVQVPQCCVQSLVFMTMQDLCSSDLTEVLSNRLPKTWPCLDRLRYILKE